MLLRRDEGRIRLGDDPSGAGPATVSVVAGFSRLVAGLRAHPMQADALLAAGLAAGYALLLLVAPVATVGEVGSAPEAVLWCVVGVLPVVFRRRWLWLSVVGCMVLAFPPLLTEHAWRTQGFAVLIVAYTAASILPLPAAIAANVLVWVPPMTTAALTRWHRWSAVGLSVLIDCLLALVGFFIGRYIRTRRAYTVALEARAAEAEANQRALARQAVGDERRRIARELHDVVAHHVSVMGVLATGARRALSRDPASADEALTAIEQTGRTTLRELRRLLDLLRADDEDAAGDLVPQPGLTALRALVERIREAGLPVTVQVDGEPYPVDAGVALTVYRLVQEALTNVLKHAGPASAQLRIGFGADELTVEVFDTGHGPRPAEPPPGAAGHGLLGMRERVALYGGELHTGPRPGGGFRVYARIPMDNLEGLSRLPTIA
jgi:signal transduction histidine kinase